MKKTVLILLLFGFLIPVIMEASSIIEIPTELKEMKFLLELELQVV